MPTLEKVRGSRPHEYLKMVAAVPDLSSRKREVFRIGRGSGLKALPNSEFPNLIRLAYGRDKKALFALIA
jgi:hypothetical protein